MTKIIQSRNLMLVFVGVLASFSVFSNEFNFNKSIEKNKIENIYYSSIENEYQFKMKKNFNQDDQNLRKPANVKLSSYIRTFASNDESLEAYLEDRDLVLYSNDIRNFAKGNLIFNEGLEVELY
jgi:hypothetical protein